MKILIVEDEFNLEDIISSKLKKEKFSVDIACDREKLYKILSNIYDLVILDVMLTRLDGFQILKKIKKENIQTKVIM